MANEEKKSIIEEALTDYNKIVEAAEANAARKLADENPEKFQKLLKEEIKNKKNSVKEPYKKVNESEESSNLDESEDNTNSTMKNKKETKKRVVNEERDKDFMGAVENDTPNLGKGGTEDGDTFVDKTTEKQESIANDTTIKEEFDVTELDLDSAEGAIDSAGGGDEIVTMDDIEQEISEMEHLKGELEKESDPFDEKIGGLKNQLQEMLNELSEMEVGIGEQKKHGGKQSIPGRENGGPTESMIEEEEVVEQKNKGGKQSIPGRENGGPTESMIEEENLPSAEELDVAMEEVDEAMGIDYGSGTITTGKLGDHDGTHGRFRKNESVGKKVTALLEQNKKLTKRINDSKKYKETVNQLVESYKSALQKYRNQLQEMAVFNTNLANVNNLLVSESLALTQTDKVKIVNEFKGVSTIAESKEKYTNLLENMNSEKQTISESVESNLTKSVGQSSKKLNEVSETTAYENDDHIKKIKSLIEYVERNDKKKVL